MTEAEQYLDSLPPERREIVAKVRDVILRNLPEGYRETIASGMLAYGIPLERYPVTYNRQPLAYAALAANKDKYSLYLMCTYMDPAIDARLRAGFAAAGRKLDMGKSCIRFRRLEDLPLDVIGDVIASTPVEQHIANYEASRAATGKH